VPLVAVNEAGGGGAVDLGDVAALREAIIATAASLRGIPYVAGGTTPSGFDCSGYTSYVFRTAIGMTIPRVSRDQWAFSDPITRAEAEPGDLVFYHSGGRVYHVAIYAGNGMVWHSPRTGDVVSKVRIWSSNVYYGRVL
jgi:cell wall-associated NlpC family hydrolase